MNCDIAIVGYGPVGATAAACWVARASRSSSSSAWPASTTSRERSPPTTRSSRHASRQHRRGRRPHPPHPGAQYLGSTARRSSRPRQPPPYPLGWPTGIHFISRSSKRCCAAPSRGTTASRCCSHELPASMTRAIGSLEVGLASAQTRSIHARYLLACDGANSPCASSSGSATRTSPDEWWVVVDAWQRRPTPLRT